MERIILDTNFLLIPAQFNLDIISELQRICDFQYEICIIDKTIDELDTIIKDQKQKARLAAQLAKKLINIHNFTILETNKTHADDLLVKFAEQGAIIATQDKGLKDRLKEKEYKTITMRQKKHLIFV